MARSVPLYPIRDEDVPFDAASSYAASGLGQARQASDRRRVSIYSTAAPPTCPRSRLTSFAGGAPKYRPYSLLKWEALAYPTLRPWPRRPRRNPPCRSERSGLRWG